MKKIPGPPRANLPSRDAADTAALASALRDTVGRFVREVRSQSGTSTTAQSEALAHLERNGPASVAALAEVRGVKHQSMRLVVSRLQELGLLELKPDPRDGRGHLVSLTSKGLQEVKAHQMARSTHLAKLLETKLSVDERVILSKAIPLLDRLTTPD